MFRFSLLAFCVLFSMTAVAGKTVRVTDKVVVGLYKLETLEGQSLTLVRTDAPLEVVKAGKRATLVKASDGTTGWIKNTYITTKKSTRLQLIDMQIRYRKSQDKLKKSELEASKLKKQLRKQKSKTTHVASKSEVSALKSQLRKSREEIANLKQLNQGEGEQKGSQSDPQASAKITTLEATIRTLETQLADEKTQHLALKKDQASAIQPIGAINPDEPVSALHAENRQLRHKIDKIASIAGSSTYGNSALSWADDISILWVVVALAGLLLLGFFAGISWLDFRQRRRHGGFRI